MAGIVIRMKGSPQEVAAKLRLLEVYNLRLDEVGSAFQGVTAGVVSNSSGLSVIGCSSDVVVSSGLCLVCDISG
jgi:hypothetical protein